MGEAPQTRYARSGDVHIAYQVVGTGPLDLVFIPGFISNVEHVWEYPPFARFVERLGSFTRLISFDKRGTGLSDRVAAIPTLEQRMDDVRAVMDAIGTSRAVLFGISEGGPLSALFAATYPDRTAALVMYGAMIRTAWAPDYPWGRTAEQHRARIDALIEGWGTGVAAVAYAPSVEADSRFHKWWAAFERAGASPGALRALLEMNWEIDARHVLPSVRVPALVIHRTGDRVVNVEHGRYIGRHVPGAKYVELDGEDHAPFVGDSDAIVEEIEEFLTGVRHGPEADRILATVLVTDIVGATQRAAALGDRRWREVLAEHHAVARRALERFRGQEVDTAGDGFLATFDGPARGVRCAQALGEAVKGLGLSVRAGLHTGECELLDAKVAGIAVHIAAMAVADEILVSSTVRDLVAGSGLVFEDRGGHALRGVPGEWRVFAVTSDRAKIDRP